MARILLNPENGAPISKIQLSGKLYFEDKPFDVDTMVSFEDDKPVDELKTIYEFLQELTLEEATAYKADQAKRTFVCPKCDNWKTTTQLGLSKHLEKHAKEEQMQKDLGIKVIGATPTAPQIEGQAAIDAQAKNDGLDVGDGLVEENTKIGANFGV